jgi:hypothetical protein
LLEIRLIPVFLGCAAALIVALTFIRYEPRNTTEEAGRVLLTLAACTFLGTLVACARSIAAAWRTGERHRLIDSRGVRIDVAGFPLPVWRIPVQFPVAAASGVLRPRLILSSRILDECSPEELMAVLRHELAHLQRHDNLVRALIGALPDALALTGTGRMIASHWHKAVEEAADDDAVRADSGARLALADTLVRVGRMAGEKPPSWMPALALFDGDSLERRVRRLLDPELPASRIAPSAAGAAVMGAVLAIAAAGFAMGSRPLHDAMEWAVRNLP